MTAAGRIACEERAPPATTARRPSGPLRPAQSFSSLTFYAPSATPTPTASSSATASASQTRTATMTSTQSGTPSTSPTSSVTPTSSASLSFGITPTQTQTPSNTRTGTPTQTPSQTMTPASQMPVGLRVEVSGGQALQFTEVLAFSPTGQLLSSSALGATANQSTTPSSSFGSGKGNDLIVDPINSVGDLVVTGTNPAGEWWHVEWAGGVPSKVASVYYVNRRDTTAASSAIVNGNGLVRVLAQNGSSTTATITSSQTVSTFSFGASLAPISPSASSPVQTDPAQRSNAVRYVRITNAAGQYLTFREIFVLDTTMTNVALQKSATSSALVTGDSTAYTAAMGCNGVIDFDNPSSGDMVSSANYLNAGDAWWQVDLGGVYNISSIVVWNRYLSSVPLWGAALAGAQVRRRRRRSGSRGEEGREIGSCGGCRTAMSPVRRSPPSPLDQLPLCLRRCAFTRRCPS
jgi:hypothetical protein